MARKKEIPRETFLESGIPRAFWELGVSTYPFSKQALDLVGNFSAKIKECCTCGAGLVLYGSSFTGKTFLATLPLKFALVEGISAKYVTLPALWDSYIDKQGFREAVYQSKILVIDDVLLTKHDGYSRLLGTVLRARSDEGFATVICVELSKSNTNKKPSLKWPPDYREAMGAKYDKFVKEVYCESSSRALFKTKTGAERIFGDA